MIESQGIFLILSLDLVRKSSVFTLDLLKKSPFFTLDLIFFRAVRFSK